MTPQEKINQVKELIFRHPFSFPGSYEHALYLSDGERICRACALKEWARIHGETMHPGQGDRGWGILGVDIYWEGPPERCVQCNKELTSEYGDPDETKEKE